MRVRLSKGSEEFEMFQDYWNLLQENWGVENTDHYWNKVQEDSERFYQKYRTPFAKDLVLACLNELERKLKHE